MRDGCEREEGGGGGGKEVREGAAVRGGGREGETGEEAQEAEDPETKRGRREDPGGVASTGGPSEHIAAVEGTSGASLPPTSDLATFALSPSVEPPTVSDPSSSDPVVGGASEEEDKVGGATGLWVELSTGKEPTGDQVMSGDLPGLVVTGCESRSSEDTTPEDSFRSALSTPDPSLNLRSTTDQSHSHTPVPEPHAGSGEQTERLSGEDTATSLPLHPRPSPQMVSGYS